MFHQQFNFLIANVTPTSKFTISSKLTTGKVGLAGWDNNEFPESPLLFEGVDIIINTYKKRNRMRSN